MTATADHLGVIDGTPVNGLEVARDTRYLGAEIGFFSVLHTWIKKLKVAAAGPTSTMICCAESTPSPGIAALDVSRCGRFVCDTQPLSG